MTLFVALIELAKLLIAIGGLIGGERAAAWLKKYIAEARAGGPAFER